MAECLAGRQSREPIPIHPIEAKGGSEVGHCGVEHTESEAGIVDLEVEGAPIGPLLGDLEEEPVSRREPAGSSVEHRYDEIGRRMVSQEGEDPIDYVRHRQRRVRLIERNRGAFRNVRVPLDGTMDKQAPPLAAGARRYVKHLGYAVAAIDAPFHGARVAPEDAARVVAAERERIERSGGMRGEALEVTLARAATQVPEWKAALDFVQGLAGIGAGGAVGYSGVSMGAFLGIPFVAEEPRITAAVFGLAGGGALLPAARRITVPLQFTVQWDDAFVSRGDALALFEAFGSREKTLHANPGGHTQVPPFERAGWEAFLLRHLGAPS